jgi:asparagine synthase (glutamine-hydrolysing)
MCGICGSTSDPDRVAVTAMCRALRHRGPDDEGTYLSPTGDVALGARRLSIIDVEDGHQPRSSEDGAVWAALNGEVYNHPALASRLRGAGHELRGHSDTEILPHLYEEYGDDLVHVVEGMYAFAIWDTRRERLLLVRDRFGEKPLFYAQRGGGLTFASELTALVAGLGSTPDLDPAALDAFFVLGYVPGSSGSILAGVRQLSPGHLLVWERGSGKVEQRRYWSPPMGVTEARESPRALAAETRRLLERSVRGRLLSDVPLGVFLSGGLDSTVVAAIAARQASARLKTFTVGYDDGGGSQDERAPAREMAALIGSEHRELVLDAAEATARIPALFGALDQPLADPALVPLHAVAEFARGEVTVAIGGEGADELFGGYPRYAWLDRAHRGWRLNGSLGATLGRRVPVAKSTSPRLRRALDLAVPRPLAERHLEWVTGGRRQARRALYGSRLREAIERDRVLAAVSGELRGAADGSVPAALMRLDQRLWLPDDVLVKADRAGMLASLEVRTAYLQRELAEFAASVAPAVHLAGGGKHLLRVLLGELLPEAPRRAKAAFRVPIASWLRGPLGPLMEDQIARGALYTEGWVHADAAGRLLAEHRGGGADHSQALWPLLAAGIWLDRFRGAGPG